MLSVYTMIKIHEVHKCLVPTLSMYEGKLPTHGNHKGQEYYL